MKTEEINEKNRKIETDIQEYEVQLKELLVEILQPVHKVVEKLVGKNNKKLVAEKISAIAKTVFETITFASSLPKKQRENYIEYKKITNKNIIEAIELKALIIELQNEKAANEAVLAKELSKSAKEPQITIREVWTENLKKLNEQKGFSLIKTYKKSRFKFAIAHFQDLVDYEELEPEDDSIMNNPDLKGITKIRMKRRVEAMHCMDCGYRL